MRQIVSRQFRHAGGFCHVEMNEEQTLFLVCSGCGLNEVRLNMAVAIIALIDHADDDSAPLPE